MVNMQSEGGGEGERGRRSFITWDISVPTAKVWGYYLETDPDPIAMVIRVWLFTHKPSENITNRHYMVTHARLC